MTLKTLFCILVLSASTGFSSTTDDSTAFFRVVIFSYDSVWVEYVLTFEQWRVFTGEDLNSKEIIVEPGTDSLFVNMTLTDQVMNLGQYAYRDVDSNRLTGSFTLPPCSAKLLFRDGLAVSVKPATQSLGYALLQNYPNPFSSTTNIAYTLGERTNVKLTVYDVLGRRISVIVNECQQAGRYIIQFSGRNLASGEYLYRLKTQNFEKVLKMVLLK